MNRNTPAIPEDAIEHARRGDKIEAIKITRERTGLSLKDAKEAIEAHLVNPRRNATSVTAHESPQLRQIPRAAIIALENGRLVEAVKHYREANGAGLKDSKEALERHLADNSVLNAKYKAASSAEFRRVIGKFGAFMFVLGLIAITYLYATGQFR